MLHTLEQQHTGPEQLRRRTTAAYTLAGIAVALWLVPIAVQGHLSQEAFRITVGVMMALSVSALIIGAELRFRARTAWFRAEAEARMQRQHDELRQLIIDGNTRTQQQLDAAMNDLGERIERVSVRVMQDYFNSYGDAVTDVAGGAAVVEGTTTKRLPHASTLTNAPGERVIPLPRHRSSRSKTS